MLPLRGKGSIVKQPGLIFRGFLFALYSHATTSFKIDETLSLKLYSSFKDMPKNKHVNLILNPPPHFTLLSKVLNIILKFGQH